MVELVFADNSIVNMTSNVLFINNTASVYGGVLCSNRNVIATINASTFNNNIAGREGGVLWSFNSTVTIEASEIHDNYISSYGVGGVLSSINSTITIEASKFDSNSATYGSITIIEGSEFASNSGGVLTSGTSTIAVGDCNFTNNSSLVPQGAVIRAVDDTKIQYHNYLLIDNNSADSNAVIYLDSSEFRGHYSGNATFSNNLGSLMSFNNNISFSGNATLIL